MENKLRSGEKFEKIVFEVFRNLDYTVETGYRIGGHQVDAVMVGKGKFYVETKFFRSEKVHFSVIEKASLNLNYLVSLQNDGAGILVVSSTVPEFEKDELRQRLQIVVWDRDTLLSHLANSNTSLKEEFEQLLLEGQQGSETFEMYVGKTAGDALKKSLFNFEKSFSVVPPVAPIKEGQLFRRRLAAIRCGRDSWREYEILMEEILKFLFASDLTLWDPQARSDDTLSRYDLVCRINGYDSFWKSIIHSFNTRFVLFEFKNYCEEVTQHQVYTTERYLYRNALRSVGFMISRKGPNTSAVQAAKGALRENGKLIMFLDDNNFNEMLDIVDDDRIASDYLSNLLDYWLVGLSR